MKAREAILLCLLFSPLPAALQAQDYTVTTNADDTVAITRYNGAPGTVMIPTNINGLTVTCIGPNAFGNIGGVTNVVIPTTVTDIESNSFIGCIALAGVTIPNGVTNIGQTAFFFCGALTGVTVPASVTNIGKDAFRACGKLTAITVDPQNTNYSSINGVLFDKNQVTLLAAPGGLSGSYTIPNGVSNVAVDAFINCSHLTSIIIPGSVTNIADDAFALMNSLSSVAFTGNAPVADSTVFSGDTSPVIYYLPGTAGWNPTFGGPLPPAGVGILTLLWNPQVHPADPTFGVQNNQFGFTITGTSNITVVVQAATDLSNPVWTPISTNTLTGGSSFFTDPAWSNYPARYNGFGFP